MVICFFAGGFIVLSFYLIEQWLRRKSIHLGIDQVLKSAGINEQQTNEISREEQEFYENEDDDDDRKQEKPLEDYK
jgi:hypothetical protein